MEPEQKSMSQRTRLNRSSTRKLLLMLGFVIVLAIAVGYVVSRNFLVPPSPESTVNFDFDTGSPILTVGQNLPVNQTSDEITAYLSSSSDTVAGSPFSIQSYETTFITLSQFSGKYLYDNKPSQDALEIRFSQQLKSISLTFATIEYQTGPTDIKLVAYMNSVDTTPVGSASARGTILTGLYPQGVLSFEANGQSFNIVRIEVFSEDSEEPVNFFVDNIRVS